ncbi:MAG TPA: hypothetical protein VHB25_16545 [Gemmatimonadaceae bacterium]|nr:hypothetical protein [Gemmatimonadaceae bacterium]
MHARALLSLIVLVTLASASARGQKPTKCHPLCAPVVELLPALNHSHVFGGPRVQSLATGAVTRLPSRSNFEMLIAVASKTMVPRLSVFGSVQWLPNASTKRNPFTLYSASELGGPVHANAPTATFGLSGALLPAEQTHGWFDANLNVDDLFSQAARPGDRSAYTHKLDLALFTHLHAFNWTPPKTYVHRVTVFGILDYVATGLPRRGDEVPQGRRYLDSARPTTFIGGLSLPITPEVK